MSQTYTPPTYEPEQRIHRLVWAPLKGPTPDQPSSQQLYMACPCHHVLYHGTRGPGKTDAQVMQFRSRVGKGYGPAWRGVIFDRKYKNLDDVISKAKRWFMAFQDGCQFLKSQGDLKFVWQTGEELLLRQFGSEDDYWNYHGQEFPFIGWNELTKYPTPKAYDLMVSCNRSSFIPHRHSTLLTGEDHDRLTAVDYDLSAFYEVHGEEGFADLQKRMPPKMPLWIRATTNPYGPGHAWVKRRFIDAGQPGEVVKTVTEVFNPQTQKREPVTKTQVHIFGSYRENIFLAPEYVAELENITEPNRREAWLYGNWDITAGGVWDDLWDADVHTRPRFAIPHSWSIFRSFDWGSTRPFSVGWWAWSDGTEATLPGGKTFAPARGSLIRFAEWYGCAKDNKGQDRIGEDEGIKMSAGDIAKGIVEREQALRAKGWIARKVAPGPADNSIRDVREADVDTIEKKMADNGVVWRESNKAPGSRKIGVQLMRDRLEAAVRGEGPGIYFLHNCKAALALLPTMPRDEDDLDDVDTEAEDHLWDETRYTILGADGRAAKALKVNLPT